MPEISVIIVTYNNQDEIKACVESIQDSTNGIETEVVIIDNNSHDKTFEIINSLRFPYLKIFKNEKNLGYTKAVNLGIKYSSGNFILLLNPDTTLNKGTIKCLYEFLSAESDYAATAPVIKYPDGRLQYSVRNFPTYWGMFCEFSLLAYIFPRSRLFNPWKAKYIDYSIPQDIYQPMAAALMLNRTWLEKYGNMDERFEMFFNDVDLCKRIYDSGFKIRLLPEAEVIHKHGASIKKEKIRMIKIWNRDCVEYFKKHNSSALKLSWLKISLFISKNIRILYHKLKNK